MPERLIWLRVLHIGGLSEIVYYNVLARIKFSVLVLVIVIVLFAIDFCYS